MIGYYRYDLLVRLAWQINFRDRTTAIVLPRNGEPVLWVSLPDGRRFAVVAVERHGAWVFVWGTFVDPADQLDRAAERIAAAAA